MLLTSGGSRRSSMEGRAQYGFTLIELIIGLIVLSILLAVAVPSYQSVIAEQRVRTTVTDLHSALALARSEAIKRNASVSLAPASGGWSAGWQIASPVTGQPELLAHIQAAGVEVVGPTGSVVFSASGRLTSAADFEISTTSGSTKKTSCLSLGLDGRVSSKKGEC